MLIRSLVNYNLRPFKVNQKSCSLEQNSNNFHQISMHILLDIWSNWPNFFFILLNQPRISCAARLVVIVRRNAMRFSGKIPKGTFSDGATSGIRSTCRLLTSMTSSVVSIATKAVLPHAYLILCDYGTGSGVVERTKATDFSFGYALDLVKLSPATEKSPKIFGKTRVIAGIRRILRMIGRRISLFLQISK